MANVPPTLHICFARGNDAKYCNEHVCTSGCLSTLKVQTSRNFLYVCYSICERHLSRGCTGKLHTFEHCKAGFLRHENLRSRAKLLPGGLLKEWRLRQTTNEEYVLHVCTQNVYEIKR